LINNYALQLEHSYIKIAYTRRRVQMKNNIMTIKTKSNWSYLIHNIYLSSLLLMHIFSDTKRMWRFHWVFVFYIWCTSTGLSRSSDITFKSPIAGFFSSETIEHNLYSTIPWHKILNFHQTVKNESVQK